jgi:hypothetical protein
VFSNRIPFPDLFEMRHLKSFNKYLTQEAIQLASNLSFKSSQSFGSFLLDGSGSITGNFGSLALKGFRDEFIKDSIDGCRLDIMLFLSKHAKYPSLAK